MSTLLKDRIEKVLPIIRPYFRDVTDDQIKNVINDVLELMGIDDTDIGFSILQSSAVTVEDFVRQIGLKNVSIPLARIKIVLMMLQGQDPFAQKEVSDEMFAKGHENLSAIQLLAKQIEQNKPIGQWSDVELLAKYGKDCPLDVEQEVVKRSKSRPCIAFNDDGTINQTISLMMLRQARYQETPKTFIDSVSKMFTIYRGGDFPMSVLYECPIHQQVLLVNGYCEECGLSWSDVEQNKEKFALLRLISDSVKLDPIAIRAYREKTFQELTALYPKIALVYEELKEEDKLPTLKRRLSKNKQGDPFRVIHSQY
ncbi:MAG: hypothetical protein Q7R33_05020 [Nitrosarchaeum sp.]|nr:hypothetical protein [Nitrosarchaeum sp.]